MLKNKKYAELIEPYEVRKAHVQEYLIGLNPRLEYEVVLSPKGLACS